MTSRHRRKINKRSKKISIENIFIIHDLLEELREIMTFQSKRFGIELLTDDADIIMGYLDAYDILFKDKKDYKYMSEKTISLFTTIYKNLLINLRHYVVSIISFKNNIDEFITKYALNMQFLHNKLLKIMY